jgi:hypothetical protein
MLYGIILYLHIDSCLHLTEAQRDELHDLMDKHNRPHYVIITTIHVSSDTNHDTAATIHFNDVKFTPLLKKITNDSIRRRIRITDGAGGHMKNSDIALWIARQHQLHGIVVDTTFQCTAHGKDLSDGEIGKGKEVLDNYQKKLSEGGGTGRIKEPIDVYNVLCKNYTVPFKDLTAKGGTGILQRHFTYTPAIGEGRINRRIQHCDTLEGIRSLHQLVDIKEPGSATSPPRIGVRINSCHAQDCPCYVGEFSECNRLDLIGKSWIVALKPLAPPRAEYYTRDYLTRQGVKLGKEAREGQFVAIELTYDSEPLLFGIVVGTWFAAPADKDDDEWMGDIKKGDELLRVRRFEPMAPGSNHFDETADIIAVFIDDIRQLDTPFKSVARVTRQGSAAVMPRWLLDSDDKRGLLEMIGDEGTVKGGNPKGHPRRFVEPDK